jgi:hypothetical protein
MNGKPSFKKSTNQIPLPYWGNQKKSCVLFKNNKIKDI